MSTAPVLAEAIRATAVHLGLLLGPVVLSAVLLHQLNVLVTRVLAGTFGPGAVVWLTGWLGTPVHELSHAAAAVLFRHRIDEIVLFRPDPAAGVVGYVKMRWSPKDPIALLGHGLVGIAPLIGGSLVLWGLAWWLAPPLARLAEPGASLHQVVGGLRDAIVALVEPERLARPQTWVFAYLALCIGSHLAPSGPDLRGAWPSLLLLGAVVALADVGLHLAGALVPVAVTVPLVAVLLVAAALVAASLVVVTAVATAASALGRGVLAPLRDLAVEPWRLVLVGASAAGLGALGAL